jgi:hypothetical protein
MSVNNRHDRRKGAKLGYIEVMTMSDFLKMPSGCAWDGCGATSVDPDKAGWSKMVLYSGQTHTDFMMVDVRHMARDCVLCPEHANHLDANLLKFIGGKLRNGMGAAS